MLLPPPHLLHAGKPPQLVSVPTHYYKVVLAENSSGKHGDHRAAVGAFVMPNAPIDPQTPVSAYAVPLEALESVAGEQSNLMPEAPVVVIMTNNDKSRQLHLGLMQFC
jgi:DNA/RNA endonuclease G (NUC1)